MSKKNNSKKTDKKSISSFFFVETGSTAVNSKVKSRKLKKPVLIIGIALIVVILALILWLVLTMSASNDNIGNTSATYPTDENGVQYATDLKGNKIDSIKDKDGNIISAGIEELVNDELYNIKNIVIENENGTFTVNAETPKETTTDADGKETVQTKQTVYTIEGFDNAKLQTDQTSIIAGNAIDLTSTNIVDIKGENLQEYGLDKPRAKATVTFENTKQIKILVGNEALSNLGTYIMIDGNPAVYLVDNDSVEGFLFSPLDLLSKIIVESADSDADAQVEEAVLKGSNIPKEMTFKINDDETNGAFYKMTSPNNAPANVANSTSYFGSVISLQADSVVAYHPSNDRLKELGLDDPYVTISVKYPNNTYTLSASQPDNEGNVNLLNEDNKIVYKLAVSRVPWVNATYDNMIYEYVLAPKIDYVNSVEVTIEDMVYEFTLERKGDDNQSEIVAKFGKTTLNSGYFNSYFDYLTSVLREGGFEGNASSSPALTVRYNYNNGKESETVTYYKGDSGYLAKCSNGVESKVSDEYVSKILKNTETISKNKQV